METAADMRCPKGQKGKETYIEAIPLSNDVIETHFNALTVSVLKYLLHTSVLGSFESIFAAPMEVSYDCEKRAECINAFKYSHQDLA